MTSQSAKKTPKSAEQDTEHFDVKAVNKHENQSLYKSSEKIYAKRASGDFRRLKWIIMTVTLGIYYIIPWLRWDRGPFAPDQAVLIDIEAGRFYFFLIELWPQEVVYITGLLILAAFSLFLFTALFGRVWCGYTCPQTVWTDLFMFVERAVEGNRNARIRLDKAPYTISKITKRVVKHAIWLAIGVGTGGAWVFYFADAPTLFIELVTFNASAVAYISVAILTGTTYLFGGFAREQICTYACPWPRIQGAMMDEQSIIVSYHPARGEPRGSHKKGASWDDRGHCVNCNQCVVVCPMGIDIRDGNQLECINCALCIDACDSVMTKLNLAKGLIRYDIPANVEVEEKNLPRVPFKPIRFRTIAYAILISIVGGIMMYGLITRAPFEINVLHQRNPAFVKLSNGDIRNTYTIKILNKRRDDGLFELTMTGIPGATLSAIGEDWYKDYLLIDADPDTVASHQILVRVPAKSLKDNNTAITFKLKEEGRHIEVEGDSSFLGPR